VQKIAEEKRGRFLDWQNTITQATAKFAGYDRTELYPPAPGVQDDWVTVVHFRSNEELEAWLNSDVRAELNRRFYEEFGDFDLRKVASGLGFWFQLSDVPPWKMVLTVVAGLYPTLLVMQVLVAPFLKGHPFVVQLLLGSFISVSCLQWIVMPPLRKLLGWWHHPSQPNRALDITGAVLVLGFLVLCAALFRLYLG
jgi:antibiotic biosynthesis monooxygenase (ABM) superfamily enzyme